MKKIILFWLPVFTMTLQAQVKEPVKWIFETKSVSATETDLLFTALIEKNWHLYGLDIPENGPVPTSFRFNKNSGYSFSGRIQSKTKPEQKYDENFLMTVPLYSERAVFIQRVKHQSPQFAVTGVVEFMSCDNMQCLPPREVEFSFQLKGGDISATATSDTLVQSDTQSVQSDTMPVATTMADGLTDRSNTQKGMLAFFLMSLLGGLLGLLTPCVFPMIPMTISFFMRQAPDKAQSYIHALFYGFSIVIIYVLIGLLVGLTSAGANLGTQLNSHWLPNLLFFGLFVAFSFSFFGMFEIVLPGSIANAADKQVSRGGYGGIFFMALTFVIVSFSCTGPIIGAILVEAATGVLLKPVVGMLGFSLGLAVPFTLLAIFPSALSQLPRSGGWMNSIKVFLGFVMLALSMKFLANIDQAYHLEILTRQAYLVIWVSIFILLFLYLLGKIRFQHDSETIFITPGRMLFALATLAFTVYLITGLAGAPLRSLNALLPPQGKEAVSQNKTVNTIMLCGQPSYSDIMHLPYGLQGYFDLDEGLRCAREKNKPALIIFKGHACSNCKQMEAKVWSRQDIQELMSRFIIIALYVDDRTVLPEEKWIKSTVDGKIKNTIGKKWADYQISHYSINSQPYHVMVDTTGRPLVTPAGTMLNANDFAAYLQSGLKQFAGR